VHPGSRQRRHLRRVRHRDGSDRARWKLFAHLASHRAELGEPQVVGISGASPTEKARLRCHEFEVSFVAMPTRLADRFAFLNFGGRSIGPKMRRWRRGIISDGRVCNAAERGLRGIALGRKSWLFCGSDRGGQRAAAMYSLIITAKMNGIDPQAWLADALSRIAAHPAHRLDELLPWNWTPPASEISVRAA
jgi:transposase